MPVRLINLLSTFLTNMNETLELSRKEELSFNARYFGIFYQPKEITAKIFMVFSSFESVLAEAIF